MVSSYDGFVLVFPQYNWGYPAVLKNAMDYLYDEWAGKPVSIMCYGGHGGFQATLAMKLVTQGLHMYNMSTNPPLDIEDTMFNDRTASDFMAQRTAVSHAAFLIPHLRDSARLLNCGCGPGSISWDLARILSSGHVTGIDREESQIELARNRASEQQLANVTFKVGSIYELPFPDSSFDVVFAHAVFEHLASPDKALAEILRVLEPGGIAAIRSPDWGGFISRRVGSALPADFFWISHPFPGNIQKVSV